MDIKGIIEWLATDSATTLITIFPYLLVGVVGLYLLWLVIGYLRVSQVGVEPLAPAGSTAVALPASTEAGAEIAPGVPYCPNDHLAYPVGAVFCPKCEADLLVRCPTCSATVRAADESCYRCGTRINEPAAATH